MSYVLPQTTAELVVRAAEATHLYRSTASTADVARFLGGTADRAENALTVACQLGLVERGSANDEWLPTDLARVLSLIEPDDKSILLRWRLQEYPPFAVFRNRILAGENSRDAAHQTCVIHNLTVDVWDAESTLLDLGTYSGSLVYGEQRRLLVQGDCELLRTVLAIHETVAAQEDTVRGHIVQRLGVKAASFATGEILNSLVDSYMRVLRGDALHDAMFVLGRGVEKWVKALADIDPAIQLPSNATTLAGAANYLKGQGRLTSKHHALLLALNAIRNAADHSGDPEIDGNTWEFTKETALAVSHLTWSLMRSFFDTDSGAYKL